MTTVSVQPTTSEPNEREAFERVLSNLDFIDFANSMSVKELIRLGFHEAWQHQQKRIDELEANVKFWQENSVDLEYKCLDKNLANESLQAKLDHKQRYLDAMDIKGGYAKLESENNALQAQLNVAIEALEKTLANTYDLSPKADFIREALAEINRIGE
jgi:hypothetical protein